MGTYNLKNESIDAISADIISELKEFQIEKQTIGRIRIAAEDILLKYQAANSGT